MHACGRESSIQRATHDDKLRQIAHLVQVPERLTRQAVQPEVLSQIEPAQGTRQCPSIAGEHKVEGMGTSHQPVRRLLRLPPCTRRAPGLGRRGSARATPRALPGQTNAPVGHAPLLYRRGCRNLCHTHLEVAVLYTTHFVGTHLCGPCRGSITSCLAIGYPPAPTVCSSMQQRRYRHSTESSSKSLSSHEMYRCCLPGVRSCQQTTGRGL